MANPLQPKVVKELERRGHFVVNVTSASKNGVMDLLACIDGLFYGFEIKWKTDAPSMLQKQKINALNLAGGRGYFIRSVEELKDILDTGKLPWNYTLSSKLTL